MRRAGNEELPHISIRRAVVDYTPCTAKTLRVLRSLSSQWRAACESCNSWQTATSFCSKNGKQVLVVLKAQSSDGGKSSGAAGSEVHRVDLEYSASRCPVSDLGLLKAFRVLEWIQELRPTICLQFHLNLQGRKFPFGDGDTIAAMAPPSLVALNMGPDTSLDGAQMRSFTISCHMLTSVAIETWADDATLTALACYCPHLKRLHLRGAKTVTDVALHFVALHSRRLEEFFLSDASEITDDGICPVIRACTFLQRLHLPFCPKLSDLTLTQLAVESGKRLLALDISGNTTVTPHGLALFLHDQVKLEFLNVSFCGPLVTLDVLEVMAIHCWSLQSLSCAFNFVVPAEPGECRDAVLKYLGDLRFRGCDVMV